MQSFGIYKIFEVTIKQTASTMNPKEKKHVNTEISAHKTEYDIELASTVWPENKKKGKEKEN